MQSVQFRLNGAPTTVRAAPDRSLFDVLGVRVRNFPFTRDNLRAAIESSG